MMNYSPLERSTVMKKVTLNAGDDSPPGSDYSDLTERDSLL